MRKYPFSHKVQLKIQKLENVKGSTQEIEGKTIAATGLSYWWFIGGSKSIKNWTGWNSQLTQRAISSSGCI